MNGASRNNKLNELKRSLNERDTDSEIYIDILNSLKNPLW